MKLEEIKNKTKEAADYLVAALESGQSEVLTQYLGAMAKFHTYSFGNIMLIARQKPHATNVAGVRTWNSLGRFVRRGEKGILILAPMIGRKRKAGRRDHSGEGRGEKGASPAVRLPGRVRLRYQPDRRQRASHLDRSARRCQRLPRTAGEVRRRHKASPELLRTDRACQGPVHGGRITLLSGMQPAEEFSTLVHEIGHEMLHRGERRTLTTKQVRETEAEAVAFVVCQAIGLENGHPPLTTSSSGMETPTSCARAWKPSSTPLP